MTSPSVGNVLMDLINTVGDTGGVIAFDDGTHAPVADPEWLDMGDVYLKACDVMGVEPIIADDGK